MTVSGSAVPTVTPIQPASANTSGIAPKFSGAPMGSATAVPSAPFGSATVVPVSTPEPATSGKAIASLVCGIIGIFVVGIVLGPIAICLATAAKNEIKARPNELKGECVATGGLVTGIVGFILSIIWILVIIGS